MAKVNLNKASVDQLERIPGIGRECAEKIVDVRNKRGGFNSVGELDQIGGFGSEAVKHLREHAEV